MSGSYLPRASLRCLAVAASWSLVACHWDLEPLRRRDVVVVDDMSVEPDVIIVDDVVDDVVVPDVVRPDIVDRVVPADVPTNTCTSRATPDWRAAGGFQFGRSIVINASTLGAPSLLNPPFVMGSECDIDTSPNPAPEQVYRYVVETGPRLYVSTDAPDCANVYDTIVYARTNCEQTGGAVLGCNDDSMNLLGCPGDARLASGLLLEGLLPGQVIYVVVDGYMGVAGQFQLVLTENGARNARRSTDAALIHADRCACRASTDVNNTVVAFPTLSDAYTTSTGAATTQLANPGDKLSGPHRMPYSQIAGLALETRLLLNALRTDAVCVNTTATFDVLINNRVVHSFAIDARTPSTVPLRVSYQEFGPITVSTGADVQVAIRLRAISPAGCGSVTFDRNAATLNNMTVLGH